MKFRVLFRIFVVVLVVENAECAGFSLDAIRDFIFPRNPEVNRVRRMEDAKGDPYAVLDTVGLAEQYGYSAEEHKVTTEDGYNLVFFRVSGSPKSPPAKGKPVVFIQHGMLASSDTWVFIGPNKGIAYVLTDAGYDVWLGNVRGNTYCRSHVNLTTADKEFWDFSWHDMAMIDIPTMIDYALNLTGQKKLYYVGHSMGTTMAYVLLSERPEYNAKIRLAVLLASSGTWTYMPTIMLRFLRQYGGIVKDLADSLRVYDVGPQTKTNAMLFEAFCGEGTVTMPFCLAGLTLSVGQPHDAINMTLAPYLIKYTPAGASIKTLLHYHQCLGHILQKFDYGRSENLKLYGSKKPPPYDFSKISAPIASLYGNTDQLGLEKNVRTVSKLLPNVVTVEAVPARFFNHLDFVISPYAKELVYNRIIELFSKY